MYGLMSFSCHVTVTCCIRTAYKSLSELRHSNGGKVCVFYSDTHYQDSTKQGPIVNFNLLRADGRVVGYHQVDKLAAVCDIHLRTGCFCNTGACMRFLGMDSERLKYHLAVSKQKRVSNEAMELPSSSPPASKAMSVGMLWT